MQTSHDFDAIWCCTWVNGDVQTLAFIYNWNYT